MAVADPFYRNQGRARARRVRFQRASGSRELVATLREKARAARTARITATPGLRLGRPGRVLEPFSQGPIEPRDFMRRLEVAIDPGEADRAR